jgi:hypothetical protein
MVPGRPIRAPASSIPSLPFLAVRTLAFLCGRVKHLTLLEAGAPPVSQGSFIATLVIISILISSTIVTISGFKPVVCGVNHRDCSDRRQGNKYLKEEMFEKHDS